MDRERARARLTGCYIPMPTLFRDGDLELNLPGMKRHVRFLLDGGVREGNGVLLVCGAAGEFTSLSVEERLRVAEAVLDEAAGKVAVILGAQSTNLREVTALARGAARLGALGLQVSPPYYHQHTDDDVVEFLAAVGEAADVALVVYTTYWQGRLSLDLVGRLAELPQVVALKWAAPSVHEYERGLRRFPKRRFLLHKTTPSPLRHTLRGRRAKTPPNQTWPPRGGA